MSLKPAVVIDGSLPRTNEERIDTVFDYARDLVVAEWKHDTDEMASLLIELGRIDGGWREALNHQPSEHVEWNAWEDEIIGHINRVLPDEWICTVGEVNPGDVIVREMGAVDDEIKAIGFSS